MLRGRRNECAALDRQLERIRVGESSVLVLRGEAGIGKTALLEYVSERAVGESRGSGGGPGPATGCRIARAAGVQGEMELAFAGLHHLCAPLLDGMRSLPAPSRTRCRWRSA
jgi:AAA ATPase domain